MGGRLQGSWQPVCVGVRQFYNRSGNSVSDSEFCASYDSELEVWYGSRLAFSAKLVEVGGNEGNKNPGLPLTKQRDVPSVTSAQPRHIGSQFANDGGFCQGDGETTVRTVVGRLHNARTDKRTTSILHGDFEI